MQDIGWIGRNAVIMGKQDECGKGGLVLHDCVTAYKEISISKKGFKNDLILIAYDNDSVLACQMLNFLLDV